LSSEEYGKGISFLIGLLISTFGSVVLAIIIYLLLKEKFKGKWYIFGAIFAIIPFMVILMITVGINLFVPIQEALTGGY